jgi:hypothetical protein
MAGSSSNNRNLKYDIEEGIALAMVAISVTGLVLIALFHP